MLTQRSQQAYANELANAGSDAELAAAVQGLLGREGIAAPGPGIVLIAHDTRPSGPGLAAAAAAGVRCLGLEPEMCGLLTTPQLHWMVMRRNRGESAGEADYYAALAGAYAQLVAGTQPLGQVREGGGSGMGPWGLHCACHDGDSAAAGPVPAALPQQQTTTVPIALARPAPSNRLPPQLQALYVDCANGVGAPKLAALAGQLAPAGLTLELRNTGDGVLNGGCGSDFLQKDRQLPSQFEGVPPGARCCAVDGDADRLMYFTPLEGGGKGGLGRVSRVAVVWVRH